MSFKKIIGLLLLVLSFSVLSFGQSGRFKTINQVNVPSKETTSNEPITQPDSYKAPDVDTKAKIKYKPEPFFTEEARKKFVGGIVALRLTLADSGEVKDIIVVRGLPMGLTENAVETAKQIAFEPATKDGKAVSQQVTVLYNFIIDGVTVFADSSTKLYYISSMRVCGNSYSKIPLKDLVTFYESIYAKAAGYKEAPHVCP